MISGVIGVSVLVAGLAALATRNSDAPSTRTGPSISTAETNYFASKNVMSKFALKFIPKKIARNFVDSIEHRLSGSNFKHKSRLPIEQMQTFGRSRAGFTHVVFGHFHEKLVMPAGETTVTIVPPWYETGEAMMINPRTGGFDWVVV